MVSRRMVTRVTNLSVPLRPWMQAGKREALMTMPMTELGGDDFEKREAQSSGGAVAAGGSCSSFSSAQPLSLGEVLGTFGGSTWIRAACGQVFELLANEFQAIHRDNHILQGVRDQKELLQNNTMIITVCYDGPSKSTGRSGSSNR